MNETNNTGTADQQPKKPKGSGLIKLTRDDPERLRRIQAQGVAAAKEAAARKRVFTEVVKAYLDMNAKDRQGRLVLSPDTGKPMTNREVIGRVLIEQAKEGNLNAINMTVHFAGEAETGNEAAEVAALQRPLTVAEATARFLGHAVDIPINPNTPPTPAEVTEDATAEEVAE